MYEVAEERLKLCAMCPATGGACDGDPSDLGPGEQPAWVDRRLVVRPCARWREHVIRKRLMAAGVPAISASATFGTYPGDEASIEACAEFYDGAVVGAGPWVVLQGPHRTGKTHLAVAILRNIKTRHPRLRVCYCNASRTESALKAFYDNSSEIPDPLAPLRSADVAVLDNFNPSKMPTWLHARMSDALLARWDDAKATVLTTREGNMKPVYGALSELTGLPSVARVRLQRTVSDE